MDTPSPLVVVAGTGTEVGKTHVSVALLRAWGRRARVLGYKPVETGVDGGTGEDARRLLEASTFHVKRPVFQQTFRDPVSPHLAARREGAPVDLERIAREVAALRGDGDGGGKAEGVLLELAGGLFSPLAPGVFNAHLVKRLDAPRVIVVAPDRLGVLHDIAATLLAATHVGMEVLGVVLSASGASDASVGTNGEEVGVALGVRLLATFPRAGGEERETTEAAQQLLGALALGP